MTETKMIENKSKRLSPKRKGQVGNSKLNPSNYNKKTKKYTTEIRVNSSCWIDVWHISQSKVNIGEVSETWW